MRTSYFQVAHAYAENQEKLYLGWIIVETLQHRKEWADLTEEEAREIGVLIRNLQRVLFDILSIDHVYIFLLGHHVDHFHVHVVPRYRGTPKKYWGFKVDEWPDAPKGSRDEITTLVARISQQI